MYSNRNCCCNAGEYGSDCGAAPTSLQPIVMPANVQTRQCYNYVEQPIICPVECRTVNNLVAVPRYYQTYTHTCCNNY